MEMTGHAINQAAQSSIPSPHPLHSGLTRLDESENGLNPVLAP